MREFSPNHRQRHEPFSIPERELHGFVNAVSDLLGSGQSAFLREIWLDELASMEKMPLPMSSEWRMVTLGAWARLANRLIDVPITAVLDHSATAAHGGALVGANNAKV